MIAPRRFLPSISSLLALEAVERLGTASAAAAELSLTHSAVSRQLKVLEDQIGVTMFERRGKGLSLTSAGVTYAQSVRDCLQDLARASHRIKSGGSRTSVNLAIHPAFGMYWLNPRLKRFVDAHPEIVLNQSTRIAPFDFARDKFDAAIHYGTQDWPGVAYLPLARDRTIPVCAPGFAAQLPLTPRDLLQMPLLHLESRPGAWESWFDRHGLHAEGLRGMLFDQFGNMAEAAACGFGVALLPEFLAEREFETGRLVPAAPTYLDEEGSYYLVWPTSAPENASLKTFVDWLSADIV